MGRLRRLVDVLTEAAPERRAETEPLRGRRSDPPAAIVVGVLVYRGVSSGEIDEPVRRLADRLGADVVLVGSEVGTVHAVEPSRRVEVTCPPEESPHVEVLVVPGGLGWKQVAADPRLRLWLVRAAASARGILTMSTGSLLLASIGGLVGTEATGHWLAESELAALGATVTSTRTASDEAGRIVSASGALAAIQVVDRLADRVRWAPDQPN